MQSSKRVLRARGKPRPSLRSRACQPKAALLSTCYSLMPAANHALRFAPGRASQPKAALLSTFYSLMPAANHALRCAQSVPPSRGPLYCLLATLSHAASHALRFAPGRATQLLLPLYGSGTGPWACHPAITPFVRFWHRAMGVPNATCSSPNDASCDCRHNALPIQMILT